MTQEKLLELRSGFETAYIDGTVASNLAYKPQFISNNYKQGKKVLSSIEDELLVCDQFQISVAFITMGGITPLLQTLRELEKRGVKGEILTTNYLNFSEPRALEKLNKLSNITLKMYDVEASGDGFHTKGYIFRKDEIYRIIIGSSNMTKTALTSNREWNTRVVSTEKGEIAQHIVEEFNELWNSEYALDFDEFYEIYKERYKIIKKQREIARSEELPSIEKYRLQPNSMQVGFIVNLKKIIDAGEERALLISATGTGKTYASAFAMRELGYKRVLFLVHRGQLARQTKKSYQKVFGKNVSMGLVGAGYSDYDADYVFAMVQTLNRDEHLYKYRPDEFDCIILDEVQFMPRFEEVLNSLLRISNIDVYVTGSNSKFLSSDIVTEFRGRGDEIRIYPLSFAEFYAAFDGDYDDAWEEYMIYGGLPQVAQFSVERQKAEYLKNIFANVYIKDVVERNRIQNVDEIGTLVDILASVIGAPTNPTKISNTFKSERGINYSNKTISNHIDYLAEAFLISKADRYDIKGRKYVGANLKYYFSDIGLRNARLNFRQQEPTHIMENIVYNELLVRGYNVDVGIVDVFAKNSEGKRVHKQLEVDFVVNQGSQRYYIQVAYDMTSEEKQTQELNSLRNIPDSFKKIVIVNGTKKPWRNEEGFVIMGMKYFLLNADSLEF